MQDLVGPRDGQVFVPRRPRTVRRIVPKPITDTTSTQINPAKPSPDALREAPRDAACTSAVARRDPDLRKLLRNLWRARSEEFDDVYQLYCKLPDQSKTTGAEFLQHLGQQCPSDGTGELVDRKFAIESHSITPDGSDAAINVLLRRDSKGSVADLRRVTATRDKACVLKDMRRSAQASTIKTIMANKPALAGNSNLQLLWRSRKPEFSDVYKRYCQQPGKEAEGGRLFMEHLRRLCPKPDADRIVDKEFAIESHSITPGGSTTPITVLLRRDSKGSLADLRRVTGTRDKDVEDVLNEMRHTARISTSRRSKLGSGDADLKSVRWGVAWEARREEFKDIYRMYCSRPGKATTSGALFLRNLAQLCRRPGAAPMADEDLRITRHSIQPDGCSTITVLLRDTADGAFDLRLLPSARDEPQVLEAMRSSARLSASHTFSGGQATSIADAGHLSDLWRTRKHEFERVYEDYCRQPGKAATSSSEFLRHLGRLCKDAKDAGLQHVVDSGLGIARYSVLPGGSAHPITVLYREDAQGRLADLRRLVRAEDEPQLLKEMGSSVIRSASHRAPKRERADATRPAVQPPVHKRIKTEPPESGRFIPRYVEASLDQARTAFYREIEQRCDLTAGTAQWSSKFSSDDAVIVRHGMEPDPSHDCKFPLRDPLDPVGRAHPRYVGSGGSCAPAVRIQELELGSDYLEYLRQLCEFDDRLAVKPDELDKIVGRLKRDAAEELGRLIREEPAPTPRCRPRRLRREDLLKHESMLIGQHGLFVPSHLPPGERPTLSNGRILGFYMGKLLECSRDVTRAAAEHPHYLRYVLEVTKSNGALVVWSAEGCANSLAFANTALLPGTTRPAYDHQRINTIFLPFDVRLTDKNGEQRWETVVAAAALDNLYGHGDAQAQVLIDYGDAFLEQFEKPSPVVKQETDTQDGSTALPAPAAAVDLQAPAATTLQWFNKGLRARRSRPAGMQGTTAS